MICLSALALTTVGCGNGEAEKQIRATMDAANRAWMKQDFERGCALHTEAARRRMDICHPIEAQAVTSFSVKEPPISKIDVDGNTAVVRRQDGGESTRMRRVEGRWLIDAG